MAREDDKAAATWPLSSWNSAKEYITRASVASLHTSSAVSLLTALATWHAAMAASSRPETSPAGLRSKRASSDANRKRRASSPTQGAGEVASTAESSWHKASGSSLRRAWSLSSSNSNRSSRGGKPSALAAYAAAFLRAWRSDGCQSFLPRSAQARTEAKRCCANAPLLAWIAHSAAAKRSVGTIVLRPQATLTSAARSKEAAASFQLRLSAANLARWPWMMTPKAGTCSIFSAHLSIQNKAVEFFDCNPAKFAFKRLKMIEPRCLPNAHCSMISHCLRSSARTSSPKKKRTSTWYASATAHAQGANRPRSAQHASNRLTANARSTGMPAMKLPRPPIDSGSNDPKRPTTPQMKSDTDRTTPISELVPSQSAFSPESSQKASAFLNSAQACPSVIMPCTKDRWSKRITPLSAWQQPRMM
mmetsp:Transcript_76969/g.178533  ORF Transcript_76969/g.178533 Transcript_76969/m.178533 type:complete len:419 (-) Transcript_76969:95-1351(-)